LVGVQVLKAGERALAAVLFGGDHHFELDARDGRAFHRQIDGKLVFGAAVYDCEVSFFGLAISKLSGEVSADFFGLGENEDSARLFVDAVGEKVIALHAQWVLMTLSFEVH